MIRRIGNWELFVECVYAQIRLHKASARDLVQGPAWNLEFAHVFSRRCNHLYPEIFPVSHVHIAVRPLLYAERLGIFTLALASAFFAECHHQSSGLIEFMDNAVTCVRDINISVFIHSHITRPPEALFLAHGLHETSRVRKYFHPAVPCVSHVYVTVGPYVNTARLLKITRRIAFLAPGEDENTGVVKFLYPVIF